MERTRNGTCPKILDSKLSLLVFVNRCSKTEEQVINKEKEEKSILNPSPINCLPLGPTMHAEKSIEFEAFRSSPYALN